MKELLERFVAAFQRGIDGEVAAMRASAAAFEVQLTDGAELGALRYGFALGGGSGSAGPGRVAAGGVSVLRTPAGDQTVTIEHVMAGDGRVTLAASQPIDLAAPAALVVAPWFLYDRLRGALERLDTDQHGVALALTLFGQAPPLRTATTLRLDHDPLDASQRAAVQLCSDSNLAFVWGPPGTGKTATLTHLLAELLAQQRRVLLVSTTNAAIDEVLAKLSRHAWFADAVAAGTIVRLGHSSSETFGAELGDVVARQHEAHHTARLRLRARLEEVEVLARHAQGLLAELAALLSPQRSLFGEPPGLRAGALDRVFGAAHGAALARREPRAQQRALEVRLARLAAIRTLGKARLAAHAAADRNLEARVVAGARVVMCTLASAYLSPLLTDQRFDVLVAEEAGMATLPALFYAACLCRERAIMVGDPRQLPPIVQSDDARIHRAIGRSIFEVTVPDPTDHPLVAMLESQYRMHPAIGAIVGRLFYAGRLVHRADPDATAAIVARPPFAGRAVALVDTEGRTTCERSDRGSSRINRASAELTAGLAHDAVRGGASSIAVITPYAAQAAEIRRVLGVRRIRDAVECSTIHRFQGRECDVVIIDLVDAPPMRPSALVAESPNLLNVSISRARGKLVIVADVAYFRSTDPDGLVAALLRAAADGG
ncbi:MAG TPA: AAA domain-containing protein [Kofleriaceae bacterium]|nr:AAA domain-containing protein [Kofleriaceae bacterium]